MSDQQPERRHIDWKGANLRGQSLTEMNLEGADFRAADCREVDFTGSNLRYADFRGAMLHNASFYKASLYGAKMQGAEAFGVDFRGADLRQTNLNGAYLEGVMWPAITPADLQERSGPVELPADLVSKLQALLGGAKGDVAEPAANVEREELGQLATQDPPRQRPKL